ncbi:MAG: DMT family transporter [Hyphomicrobiales bacterium]
MTALAQPVSGVGSRALAGIACVEIGMLLFVVQDGMMKLLLGEFTVWMLIFVRSVVTVTVLTPTILFLGRPHRLFTPLWPLHLARATLFAFGFSLFYAAFPFMGLAEVTTIFFAAPLITAGLAAIFLHETIGLHRIAALAVGFVGVLIAMNPTGDAFQPVAILPLLCALTYAMSQVIARQIGDRDTTLTTGLLTIGFAGILIAPFDYTYLPFATAMAYLVWGERPALNTLVGMVLIIASGISLGYREILAARRSVEPAPTAEAVFIPGAPAGALAQLADTLDDRIDPDPKT